MSCSMLSHAVDVKDIKCELTGYNVTLKDINYKTKGISLEFTLTAPKGVILTLDHKQESLKASSHATDFAKKAFDGEVRSTGRSFSRRDESSAHHVIDFSVIYSKADLSRPLWVKDSIRVFAAYGQRASKLMPLDFAKGGSLTVEQTKIDYKKTTIWGNDGIKLSFKQELDNFEAFEFYDAQGKQIQTNDAMCISDSLGHEYSFSFSGKPPVALKVIMLQDNKKLSIPVEMKINLGNTATGQ